LLISAMPNPHHSLASDDFFTIWKPLASNSRLGCETRILPA